MIPFIVIPPTSLKAYVTGKGNAPKELMIREVFKKWKYEADDNNDSDAYALARVAAEFVSGEKTKKFQELMKKFERIG
jgi:crossover junction endodeoxyribonuclease RuvC